MRLEPILQGAGFQVRVAKRGQDAVDLFGTWRPHFLWMYLRLPGISGVETARRIRNQVGGSKVKIAAVTALPLSMHGPAP
jgi:DNA-binding response OmpR family regulator